MTSQATLSGHQYQKLAVLLPLHLASVSCISNQIHCCMLMIGLSLHVCVINTLGAEQTVPQAENGSFHIQSSAALCITCGHIRLLGQSLCKVPVAKLYSSMHLPLPSSCSAHAVETKPCKAMWLWLNNVFQHSLPLSTLVVGIQLLEVK